jgi:hypothetical protein
MNQLHRSNEVWSTQHELRFIDRLGQHSRAAHSPSKLLKKYIKAQSLRWDWGSLDAKKVMEHAERRLASY